MPTPRILRDPQGEVTHQHYTLLLRERLAASRARASAKETLRQERARTTRALLEHRQAFNQYLSVKAQAKRDGQRLLRILDAIDRQAA